MRILITILFFIFQFASFSQDTLTKNKILPETEVQSIFTDSIKANLGIRFQIFRAYEYNDKLGKHYLVLTERTQGEQAKNDSIKAINVLVGDKKMSVQWTINDFRLKENEFSEEYSIWFWSKYIELNDIDGDGIIEPIIIYGTSGMNGTGDGRIKILTYYKDKKTAIRHQNGELDSQRNTKVEYDFYELPNSVQTKVKEIMKKIHEDGNGIFPYGWENAMANKKLAFDERHK